MARYPLRALLCAAALMTAGCVVIPDEPLNYAGEEYQRRDVSANDAHSFKEYQDSQADADNQDKAKLYVQAGMNLTDASCLRYLSELSDASNNARFVKEQFAVAGILATGVFAVLGLDSDAYVGLALGSSFAVSSYELYAMYKLLGSDANAIKKLVENSLEAARHHVKNNSPENFTEAYSSLVSYSKICRPDEIRAVVFKALAAAKPVAKTPGDVIGTTGPLLTKEIVQKLDNTRTVMTAQQTLGLYWLQMSGFQNNDEKEVALNLLGGLKDSYLNANSDTLEQITILFSSLPAAITTALANQVVTQRAAIEKARQDIAAQSAKIKATVDPLKDAALANHLRQLQQDYRSGVLTLPNGATADWLTPGGAATIDKNDPITYDATKAEPAPVAIDLLGIKPDRSSSFEIQFE